MQAFVLFVQQESEFSFRGANNESMSKHVDWPWHASPSFFAFFPRCLIALDRPSGLCAQFLICSHTSYFFHPISTALLSILLSVAGDMQGALICFLRDI